MRLSLRLKMLLVMIGVAALPMLVAGPLLVELNRGALAESEQRAQSATLGEAAAMIQGLVETIHGDALAVASAMAEAAQQPRRGGDELAGVRATLATRRSFDAVRFEVPAAHVNTVLRKQEASADEVPGSSEEMRARADTHGVTFAVVGPGRGAVVVPIEMPTAAGARGYITAAVRLEPLREELARVALARFASSHVTLALMDNQRRVIASAGSSPLAQGDDAGQLPVVAMLPAGPWAQSFSAVRAVEQGGQPTVGGVQTVPALGWGLALWRPEAEAYAVLTQMQARVVQLALGAAALAVLVALLTSRAITRPVLRLVDAARQLGQRRWAEVPTVIDQHDELGELQGAMASAAHDLARSEQEIAHQQRVRNDLGRFLDQELVDRIVRGEHALTLGGQRREVSVLFADVVAFTPLAENRSPEQVVALLNDLFSLLTEIVFRHGGTVDKFIGDCMMALWGAAEPTQDHAARALAAAADMMRFLETANEDWKQRLGLEVRLAIGVNTGDAIVGNIGSTKRMEFTAIGDTVNIAARLETMAAPNQILLSQATRDRAGDAFECAYLGERTLPGRTASTRVYELSE